MTKNKKVSGINVTNAILLIILGMIIGGGIMLRKQNENFEKFLQNHESKYAKFTAIDNLLQSEFYDDELLESSNDEMIEGALVGYVGAIDDPYTVYLKEEENTELTNELKNDAGFAGIGAVIEKQESYIVISEVLKNSPAAKSGLLPLDKIYMVDDQTLEDLTAQEAIQLIRGEKGTEVNLFIEREDKNGTGNVRFWMPVIRDEVSIPSVNSEIIEQEGKIMLYLEISIISNRTASLMLSEISEAVEQTGKIDGIILDLRGNSGGYLEEAVKILGHFFPKDTLLVKSKYKAYENIDHYSKGIGELGKYPIVILVDQLTASAGEIIAIALQESGKTIVGMQTFGKGSIQAVQNFKDGSSLKYTVGKRYSPNDVNVDKEGISPDVEVERDYEKYKEYRIDNQLETAKEELLKIIK